MTHAAVSQNKCFTTLRCSLQICIQCTTVKSLNAIL